MKGYRTFLVAIISLIAGLLQIAGVDLPPDVQKALAENLDATIGGLMTLYGIVMIIFRAVSDSPIFSKAPTPQPPSDNQAGYSRPGLLIVLVSFAALAIAVSACSSVPVPKTFNQQVAAGYISLAAVRSETANLVSRDRITVDQAQKVQDQADTLRQAIELASGLYSLGKPADAAQMIQVALDQLVRLESSLKTSGTAP